MPPLSSGGNAGGNLINIASLPQSQFLWGLPFSSNSSVSSELVIPYPDFNLNGEWLISSGGDSRIGILTGGLRGKVQPLASFPDAGAGYSVGSVRRAQRLSINWGAGANGSIACVVDGDQFARSDDDGATWEAPVSFGITTPIRGLVEMASGRLIAQGNSGGANDVAFSDDGGANWTSASSGIGTTTRRGMAISNDRSVVLFFGNGTPEYAFTESQAGAPVFGQADLGTITGQTSGPGGGTNIGNVFDDTGGAFLVGDFGDYTYITDPTNPGVGNVTLIDDVNNPQIKGNNVAATSTTCCGYLPLQNGFLTSCLDNSSVPFVFWPADDITSPVIVNTNLDLNSSADAFGIVQDPLTGTILVGSLVDNVAYLSLPNAL